MVRRMVIVTGCFVVVAACSSEAPPQATPGAVLYEGARLITGDGSAPIEPSAFVVSNGSIVEVGRKGEL